MWKVAAGIFIRDSRHSLSQANRSEIQEKNLLLGGANLLDVGR
jgi:hypothetical protein